MSSFHTVHTAIVIVSGIGGYYPAKKRRYAAFTLYRWLIRPPILDAPASIVRLTLPSDFNPMQMILPYWTMSIKVVNLFKYSIGGLCFDKVSLSVPLLQVKYMEGEMFLSLWIFLGVYGVFQDAIINHTLHHNSYMLRDEKLSHL